MAHAGRSRLGGIDVDLTRLMDRLAHVSPRSAWIGGSAALLAVVLWDGMARYGDLRLVPLYVPVLCVVYWVLGRRRAIAFAVLAAAVAIIPDLAASPDVLSFASAANAAIRTASYIFLALIITTYRHSYDAADLRAMHDGLTGVLNKMPFHTSAAQRLAEARRAGRTLLLAYVDLDGFKAVNTIHGHSAGDAALRSFSQGATSAIRGSDLVGRLGGDEFGFLLDASSAPAAEAMAHTLHQRLTAALARTGLPLSCSMGALIVDPASDLSEGELIAAADRLMLQAKAVGKDRALTRRIAHARPEPGHRSPTR